MFRFLPVPGGRGQQRCSVLGSLCVLGSPVPQISPQRPCTGSAATEPLGHLTAAQLRCVFTKVIFGINSFDNENNGLLCPGGEGSDASAPSPHHPCLSVMGKLYCLTDFKCARPYGFPVNYIWILLKSNPATAKEELTCFDLICIPVPFSFFCINNRN